MDSNLLAEEAFDLHFHSLQDFLQDEDKIVTFKWLSHELGIHANHAKELLKFYVKCQKDLKREPLTVTHLLYGRLTETESYECCLVIDEELVDKRTEFKDILWEHIYSIQSKVSSVDPEILYTVNKSISGNCLGAVGYENEIERKSIRRADVSKPKVVSTTSQVIKETKNVDKKSSIGDMFQKQPKKEKEPEQQSNGNTKPKVEKEKPTAAKKGIANFFSKQNAPAKLVKKPEESPAVKSQTKEEKESQNGKNEKNTYKSIIDTDDEMDVDLTPKPEVKRPKKSTKKRARTNSDEQQKSQKKHKRIVQYHQSDSSEDDIFASTRSPSPEDRKPSLSDDDDIIPPTPEVENNSKGKIRKRKLKERTYHDDEGYMVTKKEFVMETDSEAENEAPAAPAPLQKLNIAKNLDNGEKDQKNKNQSKKKTSPKKQKTLTSFFQKR